MPTGDQQRQMRRFAGSCRSVFNKVLALQKERFEQGEKKLGYAGLCKLLTVWRNGSEMPWLKDAPVHPLQQSLKDLERPYSNFFARRADFPRFKKKGQSESFRAKSGLNKAILDQGWFEFRRQLDYKLKWNGGYLIAVPPQNTSRTCPACSHVSADNRQTQAGFECVECGFEENADVVGAINILRVGHARFACEVSDAARSPAAGTHRSDSVQRAALSVP